LCNFSSICNACLSDVHSQWPSIDCHGTNGSQDGAVDMLTIQAVQRISESRVE
jgi:hypothetical protein